MDPAAGVGAHPARVLDAGRGTGDFAPLIAASSVVCVESSPAGLAAARDCSFTAHPGRIEELLFDDSKFDDVILNWTLYHMPDHRRGISEPDHVLRRGGRLFGRYNFRDHLTQVGQAAGDSWGAAFPGGTGHSDGRRRQLG
ncbi:MAG: class I SAM-dependent methyltransferase [Candidatus Dormibacteria bacterium]